MKKLTFIATTVAGIFIAQINSQAQGLYAGVGVGYGFPSQVQAYTPASTSSGTSTSYTSQSASLGKGMSVGIYGGYMVTKNIGFELGISDKLSSTTSTTSGTSAVDTSGSLVTTSTGSNVNTIKSSLFRLTPAIRFAVGDGMLQGYMVTGLIIGFPTATNETAGTNTSTTYFGATELSSSANTSDEIVTYSGSMIIGFHGAIGVLYSLSDNIGIFGELSGNFQTWAPTEAQITTLTYNGVNELNSLTTSQKQTNYESTYTVNTASNTPGSPTEAAKMYLPFSTWGITIGVHFNFGGATAAATK